MQLLIIVLNQVDKLDNLIDGLVDNGFTGATILNSTGMMKELAKTHNDYPLFGSLRFLVDADRKESKTIFMVISGQLVEKAKNTVREVIGDLSKPDTAILFTLPVLSTEGIDH